MASIYASLDRRQFHPGARRATSNMTTARWYTGDQDSWSSSTNRRHNKSLGMGPAGVSRSCNDIRTWSNGVSDDNGGFDSNQTDCLSEFEQVKDKKRGRMKRLFGSLRNLTVSRSHSLRIEGHRKGSSGTLDSYRSKDSIEEVEEDTEVTTHDVHDNRDDFICPYGDADMETEDDIIPYSMNENSPSDEIIPYPHGHAVRGDAHPVEANGHCHPIGKEIGISDDQIYPLDSHMRVGSSRRTNGHVNHPVYMVI